MFEMLQKMIADKKEYKQMMARANALPEDYTFVFDRMQKYMWNYCKGDGYDMLKIHYELIELFEAGAANGQAVLEITGEDVAAFCDELLRNARTYTDTWRMDLNQAIAKKIK